MVLGSNSNRERKYKSNYERVIGLGEDFKEKERKKHKLFEALPFCLMIRSCILLFMIKSSLSLKQ